MNELARELLALTPAQRALLEQRLKHKKKQSAKAPSPQLSLGIQPRANQHVHPLSVGQQRLLALEALTPGTSRYTIAYAYRLQGKVELPFLERAVRSVVARHEVVRTAYIHEQGAWRQEVYPVPEHVLSVLDYSAGAYDQQWEKALAYTEKDGNAAFDLDSGLLLRATIIKVRVDEYLFFVSMHHLVADGWSFEVLFREISHVYKACIEEHEVALPALPIQYADFSAWQSQWLRSEAAEKHRAYWVRRFHERPAPTIVPAYRKPGMEKLAKGHGVFAVMPHALYTSVVTTTEKIKRTPYALFLAAFKALLYRYTAQPVLTVSTPVSGRNHVEVESMIGFFNNLLILSTALNDDMRFDELVATVASDTIEAGDYQDVPFEHIASLPTMRHMPIGRLFFAFQDVSSSHLQLPGIETTSISIGLNSADFDLSLNIEYAKEEVCLWGIYKTAFFEESTVKALLSNYITVLEHIVADPHRRIGDLPAFNLPEMAVSETTIRIQGHGAGAPSSSEVASHPSASLASTSLTLEVEEQLVQIWSEALGGIEVGVEDDLPDLGVHSLMAIEAFAKMYQQIKGCAIPLSSLLEERTVARLARRISQEVYHE